MSEASYDQCRFCGKRIRYTLASTRRREYCDDACRQGAYRWRKALDTNADIAAASLARWQKTWEKLEYPDKLIEALSNLWRKIGDLSFLNDVLPILQMHEQAIIQKYAKMAAKRNEP